MKDNIAEYLRRSRLVKNMSQRALAKKLGYHAQYISNWERNRCLPPVSIMRELCKILSLDVETLVSLLVEYEKCKWLKALR